MCINMGCREKAGFGWRGYAVCGSHYHSGMPVLPSKCAMLGCSQKAYFGPDELHPTHCRGHKAEEHVKSAYLVWCQIDGCTYPGDFTELDTGKILCHKHRVGTEGFYRCFAPYCFDVAEYGPELTRKKVACHTHALRGMKKTSRTATLGVSECDYCVRRARYKSKYTGRISLCSDHKDGILWCCRRCHMVEGDIYDPVSDKRLCQGCGGWSFIPYKETPGKI